MRNDIINGLTSMEEIELIYCHTKTEGNRRCLNYTVVVSGDSVTDNVDACKKIIAVMEIIKELYTKYGMHVHYDIKSSSFLEKTIINSKNRNKFEKAEIVYSKDDYFQNLIEKKYTRA